jgi:hypothetical protein
MVVGRRNCKQDGHEQRTQGDQATKRVFLTIEGPGSEGTCGRVDESLRVAATRRPEAGVVEGALKEPNDRNQLEEQSID